MSKLRPVLLAIAACATTAILIPLGAHPAGADVPPPNVEGPGIPFGLCSVIDEAAESQDNKCKKAGNSDEDDETDDKKFPFDDEDEDDDEDDDDDDEGDD